MIDARRAAAAAALSLVTLVPLVAAANPAGYVATPQIEEGEKEVELVVGAERGRDRRSGWGTLLKLGYAPTAWWAVEVATLWHREPGERAGYDAWEIEQRFALTDPGRYPVDLGLLLEIEHPKDRDEGWELRWGPLLQTEWGAMQANLNVLFERHLRAAAPAPTELGYQWQVRWRADRRLDLGAQGFGAVGPWRRWAGHSEQSHQAGPAIFGKLGGGQHGWKYDAALLFGSGGESPRRALRARLEYEFH